MVGLIVVSVELWGPDGSISSDCNIYVSDMEFRGPNIATLAWLEQDSICMFRIPPLFSLPVASFGGVESGLFWLWSGCLDFCPLKCLFIWNGGLMV